MDEVWELAAKPNIGRRKIVDLRIAKTLIKEGVEIFITANDKDFRNLGFLEIINPIA